MPAASSSLSRSPLSTNPSRRSLVKVAAWTAPVILSSYAMPALAASAIGCGTIAWITPRQIVGAGYTGTIQGKVTKTSGALPTQVTVTYAGTSITGDPVAPVDPGTGIFSLTIAARSVEAETTITASAPGFGSASVIFGVFLGSPEVLTFTKVGTMAKSRQPVWASRGRTTSGGITIEKWSIPSMLVGADSNLYGIPTGGFFTSSKYIGSSVVAGSAMSIGVISNNNPMSRLYWLSGTYGWCGPRAVPIIGGSGKKPPFRAEVGKDGTVPTNDGSPGLDPADSTNYNVIIRPQNDSLAGCATTTTTLELAFDALPNYKIWLTLNYT